MTLLQGMALYSLMSWFTGSALGLGYVMISLFVTCLMVVYDTQIVVDQSERGFRDVPSHAVLLFVDLFKMFVKIVQVLIELNRDSDKRKKRKN